jgi:hypothetical protein
MGTSLLDRDAAIAAVHATLDAAASGHGRTLFIVGEAGLGKTSILEHALDAARGRFQVGSGRGDAVDASLPFGLPAQALGDLVGAELFE